MEYGHCCEGWMSHVLTWGWVYLCVCVHLLITCCYQRLATRPRVCIFPADWPQSASPPPALWLAAQTGAPANRNTNKQTRKVDVVLLVDPCDDYMRWCSWYDRWCTDVGKTEKLSPSNFKLKIFHKKWNRMSHQEYTLSSSHFNVRSLRPWSPRTPGHFSQPTRREKHHFSGWYLSLVSLLLWCWGEIRILLIIWPGQSYYLTLKCLPAPWCQHTHAHKHPLPLTHSNLAVWRRSQCTAAKEDKLTITPHPGFRGCSF